MDESNVIDNLYFEWLYGLVGSVQNRNPSTTHWSLAKRLYSTPFYWFVPNDDNRAEDGKELRGEFLHINEVEEVDQLWLDLDCSFLEMLIALSRRASFESNGEPYTWFWKLLSNIGLEGYTDHKYTSYDDNFVSEVLDYVMRRAYSPNGSGGLFPLSNPHQDQTKIELWYQMSAYLIDVKLIPEGG